MGILIGVIVVVAIFRALVRGVESVIAAGGAEYRRRRDAWATTHPGVDRAARRAGRAAAATVVTGVGAVGTFWRAFREEYPLARDRYRARWGRNPPPPPDEPAAVAEPAGPADQVEPPPAPPNPPTEPDPLGPEEQRSTPPMTQAAVTTEVTTVAAARAALHVLRENTITELDDVLASATRAKADLDLAVSLAEQSAVVFDQDPVTAAAMAGAAEPIQMRYHALNQQAGHLETALGQIDNALQGISTHDALETAHADKAGASRREAYQPA